MRCVKTRFVAILLCIVLCVGSVVIPASAVGSEGTFIASTGTGSVSAGSGTLIAGGLPILSYITAAGVSIYSVSGILTSIERMYNALDNAIQAELIEIENGGESFILSESMAAALLEVYNDEFFDTNGTFQTLGLSYDMSELLAYNYDAQFEDADLYPTGTVCTNHLTETPVQIGDTTITAALTVNQDGYGVISFENTATGVTLVFNTESDFTASEHCNYFISAPVVCEAMTYDTVADESVGFWVMRVCNGEEYCDDTCFNDYYTVYYTTNPDFTTSGICATMDGTGVAAIDGKTFYDSECLYLGNWWWYPNDGSDVVMTGSDIMTGLVCDEVPYTQALENEREVVAGDTLYIAPEAVCENIDTLTQDAVITGEFPEVSTNTDTSVDVPDTTMGFFKKVWNGGLEFVDQVADFFGGFFDNVGETVSDFFTQIKELITGDGLEDTGGFFAWMRNLWNCLPADITKFFAFVVSVVVLIGVMRMFW